MDDKASEAGLVGDDGGERQVFEHGLSQLKKLSAIASKLCVTVVVEIGRVCFAQIHADAFVVASVEKDPGGKE